MRVVTVSYSELAAHRQCPLKHRLAYIERWSRTTGGARALGTRWHAILATHYGAIQTIQNRRLNEGTAPARGESWIYSSKERAYILSMVSEEMASQPADKVLETLQWMYVNHCDVYGYQGNWTVVGVEYEDTFPLPEIPGSDIQFKLKVIIDLIVKDAMGHFWLIDHKSGQTMPSKASVNGTLSDQFGLYDWLLTASGFKIHGDILQFMKTTKYKAPTPAAGYTDHFPMDRTEAELEELAHDAVRTAYAAYTWPTELLGNPPSNPSPEMCTRFCDFLEAHVMERRGLAPIQEYLRGTGFQQDINMVDPRDRPDLEQD